MKKVWEGEIGFLRHTTTEHAREEKEKEKMKIIVNVRCYQIYGINFFLFYQLSCLLLFWDWKVKSTKWWFLDLQKTEWRCRKTFLSSETYWVEKSGFRAFTSKFGRFVMWRKPKTHTHALNFHRLGTRNVAKKSNREDFQPNLIV